jgi:hypothetical protein
MKPITFVLALALPLASACNSDSGPTAILSLTPVLDSAFVGDTVPAPTVQYLDHNGNALDPGTVRWFTDKPTVLQVDSLTGESVALQAGLAVLQARARNLAASALVVVSRPVSITLLLDTLYLMPGDTITVPVTVVHQAPGTPTVWFLAAPNAVFTLDQNTGLDSAKAPGGPLPFVAFAALGADTAADSGTVEVVGLTDTTGGKAAYTLSGTVVRSARSAVQAINYPRNGDTATFRLRAFISQGATTVEAVVITARTEATGVGTFSIDSISPAEISGAGGVDPFCRPPRNWGSWSTIATTLPLQALSRQGGQITITKTAPVPNGLAIGGRFLFTARRLDLYDDPLGSLPVRGTFVAPLVAATSRCSP